jgi:hypothetical protein
MALRWNQLLREMSARNLLGVRIEIHLFKYEQNANETMIDNIAVSLFALLSL